MIYSSPLNFLFNPHFSKELTMLYFPNFLISLLCFISTFPSKVESTIANVRQAAYFLSQVAKLVYLVAKLGYLFSLQTCDRLVESCLEAPQQTSTQSELPPLYLDIPGPIRTPAFMLFDKNGNPLRGAALKARLRKLGAES